jgi:hypothetical protein
LQKKGNNVQQIGNKTECAMLTFIEGFGVKYEALRQAARVQRMYHKKKKKKKGRFLLISLDILSLLSAKG